MRLHLRALADFYNCRRFIDRECAPPGNSDCPLVLPVVPHVQRQAPGARFVCHRSWHPDDLKTHCSVIFVSSGDASLGVNRPLGPAHRLEEKGLISQSDLSQVEQLDAEQSVSLLTSILRERLDQRTEAASVQSGVEAVSVPTYPEFRS